MLREKFDYSAYLNAKRAIDDRSLNPDVWSAMAHWVALQQPSGPLRVLEIGAGIGTMIERWLESTLATHCLYTALEREAGFADDARKKLARWCRENAYGFDENGTCWRLENRDTVFEIRWVCEDAFNIANLFESSAFDLVLGHAVIDLLPVPLFLPDLLRLLTSQGAFYFSINYAGETVFTPALESDVEILSAYHRDMDNRFPELEWRPSHTGSLLGGWLEAQGHVVAAQGPSDWKIHPGSGRIEDRIFMGNILDTIETALTPMPELNEWLSLRRHQLAAGKLGLRASNRDCFGHVNRPII